MYLPGLDRLLTDKVRQDHVSERVVLNAVVSKEVDLNQGQKHRRGLGDVAGTDAIDLGAAYL